MGGQHPCFLHSDPGFSRDRDSVFIYSKMILVGSKIHACRQGSHECGGASSLYNQKVSIMEGGYMIQVTLIWLVPYLSQSSSFTQIC